jgi:hypothetical protein
MNSENLFKLINFSLARAQDSSKVYNRQPAISMRYCAPEIFKSMWQACLQGKVSYESSISDNDIRQRRVDREKLPN